MAGLKSKVEAWFTSGDELAPIVTLLQVRPIGVEPGRVVVSMPVQPALLNPMGALHGGVFGDLADIAMGAALAMSLDESQRFVTTTLSMILMKSVKEGQLTATGVVIRKGRDVAFLECQIEQDGVQLARAAASCVIRQI